MKNPNTYEHAGNIHAKQTGELIRKDACRHYQLFFITSDGAALSFASVKENFCAVLDSVKTQCNDGWQVIAMSGEHECDEPVFCDHSGEQIC